MAAWDNDKIIRVDMTRRTVSVESYPDGARILESFETRGDGIRYHRRGNRYD